MGKTKLSDFEFLFGPPLKFYKTTSPKKTKYDKLKLLQRKINKLQNNTKLKQIVYIILLHNKNITYNYEVDFEVDLLNLSSISIKLIEELLIM